MKPSAAVACGHPAVADAVEAVLQQGGNAYDAVLAAMASAAVVEPVLASIGGGGYLLAHPAGGAPRVYDFFAQTPRNKQVAELDFYPVEADFGDAVQEFHIGLGSCATPGFVKGFFQIADDLAVLPPSVLLQPAIDQARHGVAVTPMQAHIYDVIAPIYQANAETRAAFQGAAGGLPREGEVFSRPPLATTLEALAEEGEALFYRGELARRITDLMGAGGFLTMADFDSYEVILRDPLKVIYRDAEVYMNPPPSSGGILLAFALELLKQTRLGDYGSLEHLVQLVKVMELTQKARLDKFHHPNVELLATDYLDQYRQEVADVAECLRGTTHISVVDAQGNLAAMTLSNGEGCGVMVPESGFMLNNMLGEEDINPHGFGNWQPDQRMSSMMTPTIMERNGYRYCLGSGGSNRIRSAILQVLLNLLDFRMPLREAVHSSRVHFEDDATQLEAGIDGSVVQRLAEEVIGLNEWSTTSLYFGGVHSVATDGTDFVAVGDTRRGGVGRVIQV